MELSSADLGFLLIDISISLGALFTWGLWTLDRLYGHGRRSSSRSALARMDQWIR
jgi:hypothetical protein